MNALVVLEINIKYFVIMPMNHHLLAGWKYMNINTCINCNNKLRYSLKCACFN